MRIGRPRSSSRLAACATGRVLCMVVMWRHQKLREERLGGEVLLSKLSEEIGMIDGSYYAVLWETNFEQKASRLLRSYD